MKWGQFASASRVPGRFHAKRYLRRGESRPPRRIVRVLCDEGRGAPRRGDFRGGRGARPEVGFRRGRGDAPLRISVARSTNKIHGSLTPPFSTVSSVRCSTPLFNKIQASSKCRFISTWPPTCSMKLTGGRSRCETRSQMVCHRLNSPGFVSEGQSCATARNRTTSSGRSSSSVGPGTSSVTNSA